MFFGITIVSAATLGWLGWELVAQNRDLEIKRAVELRENAAGLAVGSLQKHLAHVEERLTALANAENEVAPSAGDFARELNGDSVLLILHNDGLDAYPNGRLLYYPVLPRATEAAESLFAESEVLEVQQKDFARAVALLEPIAASSSASIRAAALVRIARNLRHLDHLAEASAVYSQLSELGSASVAGKPAELFARYAMLAVLDEQRDHQRLLRDATALYTDLHNGRWRILRKDYDAYNDRLNEWLGSSAPSAETSATEPVTQATESLWDQWQNGKASTARQAQWFGDQPVLVIAQTSAARTAALVAGPRYIGSWLSELDASSHGVRIALTDAAGHHVSGPTGASTPLQYAVAPWTLSAIPVNNSAPPGDLTLRNRLVMSGLAAIAVLVVGGSYLIGRGVARELAVARLRSDFVAAVSHEFRTPLTALRQLSELLAKGRVPNDEVRQKYYDVLEQESSRMHRLVEGLLKFGRMEAGAMRYQFETINAAELLHSVVDEFGREAERRGCTVELNATDSATAVRADREALGCAVWNLLDNAVKYSPECHTIWVDLARENGNVAISVRDRGVGIRQEDRKRIFQKFERGDVSKTLGVQGAGIGLAVVQQIVGSHGGQIQLESEPGKGSKFTMLLPETSHRRDAEGAETAETKRSSASSAPSASLR
jgi:signal transduction histidine kinase